MSTPPSPLPAHDAALPRYGYMVFILGILACLGPITIDAYLPAFGDIGRAFVRTPAEVQSTLGYYMLAYALTTLVHGTLSDTFGRRPVLLTALAVYTLGAIIAAAAPSFEWLIVGRVLQGLSAGAGMIIGQAVVNDCYKGPMAQRALSYIIMVFSVSPAIAPIVGGYLTTSLGWRSIFALMAGVALISIAVCAWALPETLPKSRRRPFAFGGFLASILHILKDRVFTAYALAFGVLFAGLAFVIGGAHDFVTHVLRLPETAFGYLFVPLVMGMLTGSALAVRLAKRIQPARLIGLGYAAMALSCLFNLGYTSTTLEPVFPWAVVPLALFSCGLCIAIPSMTLTVLQRAPGMGGTAASVLGFIQMVFFSVVSGWGVALVYGSAWRMAVGLTLSMAISGGAWWLINARSRSPVRS